MPNWSGIAGALAGAGRGYEAAQGRNIPGAPQDQQQSPQGQNGGLLMNYLRRRQAKQGVMGQAQAPTPTASPMQNSLSPMSPPPNQYEDPMGGAPSPYTPTPMAQGRIVDKPTTALLGEDGPEAVIPLNGRADAKLSTANLPQMKYNRGC